MKERTPPRSALWLLKVLGYMRRHEALIGDIYEELHNGKSRGWYWRQTAKLILGDVRRNAARPLIENAVFFLVLAANDYIFSAVLRVRHFPWWSSLMAIVLWLALMLILAQMSVLARRPEPRATDIVRIAFTFY